MFPLRRRWGRVNQPGFHLLSLILLRRAPASCSASKYLKKERERSLSGVEYWTRGARNTLKHSSPPSCLPQSSSTSIIYHPSAYKVFFYYKCLFPPHRSDFLSTKSTKKTIYFYVFLFCTYDIISICFCSGCTLRVNVLCLATAEVPTAPPPRT